MLNYILLLTNLEKIILSMQVFFVCTEREKLYHYYITESAIRIIFIKQQPELHCAFSGI